MHPRILISGLAVAAIVVAGCSSGEGSGGTLDDTSWTLTSYAAGDSTVDVPDGVFVDAIFEGAATRVSGSAGCNRYNTDYNVDGNILTFGVIATTSMACVGPASEVETAYLANLAASKTFTATSDALTIYDSSNAAILTYAVAEPTSLVGTTWHATGINNGNQGVESVVTGSDPTAIFADDGTVSGDAGCNQYNGPAVVDGDSITIGPLASTLRACAEDAVTTQEANFLAALQNATTYEAVAGHLELRDDSGALQVSFEQR
jgi:heat shock protein HslJ